jgi:archaemetzincin
VTAGKTAFFSTKQNSMKAILLLLLGFSDADTKMIKKEVESFYHVKVTSVQQADLPEIAYEPIRKRYKANEILDYLVHAYPEYTVLAITSKDIAMSKHGSYDWGILGYSIVGRGVSVVSTHRIKSRDLLVKVVLHEFGHGQGLPHCSSADPCIMKDAKGKGKTISQQPKALCKKCNLQLKISRHESNYHGNNLPEHVCSVFLNAVRLWHPMGIL